ncbi:hypothetical protein N7519_009153 [Penicillium mononematosum]|uniref:uncharacterized protein n=1 Tax=Penicillium mononematosum TaxID=268346 RepID=UPI0025488E45|nr:uncharacterized protein N7519_009153 [Penicillium mononematosum]KAJ6178692.1 hypothetical protein N7519_009153 [Penicillium mononematosum]
MLAYFKRVSVKNFEENRGDLVMEFQAMQDDEGTLRHRVETPKSGDLFLIKTVRHAGYASWKPHSA